MSADWQQALSTWLAAHKTYPDEARRQGAEGTVALRFTIDRSGRVLQVELVHGAGSSVLDAAAESMLRGATLPPLPATMPQDKVTVTVRIHYRITDERSE
jgi:protein TonB